MHAPPVRVSAVDIGVSGVRLGNVLIFVERLIKRRTGIRVIMKQNQPTYTFNPGAFFDTTVELPRVLLEFIKIMPADVSQCCLSHRWERPSSKFSELIFI